MKINDFSFLPLGFNTINNVCFMNYSTNGDVYVKLNGLVYINSNLYFSEFVKEIEESEYTITLYSKNNTYLEFNKIHDILLPSMQTSTIK